MPPGVVALMLQAKPSLTPAQALSRAQAIRPRRWGSSTRAAIGAGLIDAARGARRARRRPRPAETASPFFSASGAITTADPMQSGRLNRNAEHQLAAARRSPIR